MTIDQTLVVAMDEKDLKNQGKYFTGSFDQLVAMGFLPAPPTENDMALKARRAKRVKRRAERHRRKEG